jgi:hypothetical protein
LRAFGGFAFAPTVQPHSTGAGQACSKLHSPTRDQNSQFFNRRVSSTRARAGMSR